MTSATRPDATGIHESIVTGAASATEVWSEHRQRWEAGGDRWRAIVDVDLDAADAAAADLDDRRARGEALGALTGVPMTVKDSFDVAGMRTTHGRLSDAHRATADAPAVARARAGGAVIFGKTNVPVLLSGYQTLNDDFGRTLNPWHEARAAGGSSGGSAVAVATGLSALELGSDLIGSIRIPAAWNGIFGHRPSNGIVSKRGHLPWRVDARIEPPVSVSGPLARSARDIERAVAVLAGPAEPEASAWRLELPAPRRDRLRGTRVGLWTECAHAPIDDEMRAGLRALAAALEAEGCRVVEVTAPPGADEEGLALFERLMLGEIAHSIDDAGFAAALASGGDSGVAQRMRDAWRDAERQREIRDEWNARVFCDVDVVLAPAVPGAAPLHDDRPETERTLRIGGRDYAAPAAISAWSSIPNLAMLPCTVIPLGLGADTGLPLGGQLIGPFLHDRTTLRIAALAERAGLVGFAPPPVP
ncbi:amidase family protein [Microbacterium sp. LRZ72]|uniref:amidase family protein n=1 Tax=Microbacterium sp. LRZ72 TaxID=2942481 RepID=UPI0029B91797|nr:amidase family protein [Microbacterium sp. LRZ72]MDX2377098.1 amidase family protein [Microbacterium sp. LRZ72]